MGDVRADRTPGANIVAAACEAAVVLGGRGGMRGVGNVVGEGALGMGGMGGRAAERVEGGGEAGAVVGIAGEGSLVGGVVGAELGVGREEGGENKLLTGMFGTVDAAYLIDWKEALCMIPGKKLGDTRS